MGDSLDNLLSNNSEIRLKNCTRPYNFSENSFWKGKWRCYCFPGEAINLLSDQFCLKKVKCSSKWRKTFNCQGQMLIRIRGSSLWCTWGKALFQESFKLNSRNFPKKECHQWFCPGEVFRNFCDIFFSKQLRGNVAEY